MPVFKGAEETMKRWLGNPKRSRQCTSSKDNDELERPSAKEIKQLEQSGESTLEITPHQKGQKLGVQQKIARAMATIKELAAAALLVQRTTCKETFEEAALSAEATQRYLAEIEATRTSEEFRHDLGNILDRLVALLVKNSSGDLQNILQREVGEATEAAGDLEQQCPHVQVAFGSKIDWFHNHVYNSNKNKNKNRPNSMAGLRFTLRLGLQVTSEIENKLFYEDLDTDVLEVEVANGASGSVLGEARIPLSEVDHGLVKAWPIYDYSDGASKKIIGSLEVKITLHNRGLVGRQTLIFRSVSRDLRAKIFSSLKFDCPDTMEEANEKVLKDVQGRFVVSITDQKEDGSNDLDMANEVGLEVKSSKTGQILHRPQMDRGYAAFPVSDLEDDLVEITTISEAKPHINPKRKSSAPSLVAKPNFMRKKKSTAESNNTGKGLRIARPASWGESLVNLVQQTGLIKGKTNKEAARKSASQDDLGSYGDVKLAQIRVKDLSWDRATLVNLGSRQLVVRLQVQHRSIMTDLDILSSCLLVFLHDNYCELKPATRSSLISVLKLACSSDSEIFTLAIANAFLKLHCIQTSSKDSAEAGFPLITLEKDIRDSLESLSSGGLDPQAVEVYKNFCLKVISCFHVRQLILQGAAATASTRDRKPVSALDLALDRANIIVHTSVLVYTDHAELRNGISDCMRTFCKKYFGDINVADLSTRANTLCEKVTDYGLLTLETILKRCGNFAITTWCPLLAEAILDTALPLIEDLITEAKKAPTLKANVGKFFEVAYALFFRCREVAGFIGGHDRQNISTLYTTFQPCLKEWVVAAALKANEQVQRVLEIEREAHQAKMTSSVFDETKKKKPSSLFKFKARPGKKKQFLETISRLESASIWEFDQEHENDWIEGAISVNGIFQTCNNTWKSLEWPDPVQSLEFGTGLFQAVNGVFKVYTNGLHEIIMLDKYFDHHELVLGLNSIFTAFRYLDSFMASLRDLMHNLATKNDDDGFYFSVPGNFTILLLIR